MAARRGFATVTTTALRGQKVLRFCTINPRTTDEDLQATIDKIKELAGGIDLRLL